MHLSQAIELFLGEQTASTARSYFYVLRAMQNYVGPARPLAAVDPALLLAYSQVVRERPTITSPVSINKHIKTIRTFFNWCVKTGLIDQSPAAGLRCVRQPQSVPRAKAMPDEHYRQLVDYAQRRPRYLALVLFLGDTGCRIGGAAGLRWSEINFAERRAIVTEKGGEPRPVWFGRECAYALSRWRLEHTLRDGDYVFQRHGRRMLNDSLGQLFEKLCRRAGIGAYGPHSLRHRKGHQFADAHVAPSLAAVALGHGSPVTTLTYYYPQDWDRVRAEVEKLAYTSDPQPANILRFRLRKGE
jgi:integrase/recombinase XerC